LLLLLIFHFCFLNNKKNTEQEWRVVTGNYSASSKSRNDLDEEVLGYIQDRLRVRFALKENREWDKADAIRDELREQKQYAVSIDDRNNEFSILVDEFTIVDDVTATTTSDNLGRLFQNNSAAVLTSSEITYNPPKDWTIVSSDTRHQRR
jgi:hypothetical protein